MTTPMSTRSTANMTSETKKELKNSNSTVALTVSDSIAHYHRIETLEEKVKQMSLTIESIPSMFLELQKLIESKVISTDVPSSFLHADAKFNVNPKLHPNSVISPSGKERLTVDGNYQSITDDELEKDLEDDDDFKKSHQNNLVSQLKILNHFYSLFPTVDFPANFRRYDIMLKFFIDIQKKFAYHDVPPTLQVKILLRVMEGSDVVSEFLRRTEKFRNDHVITSADIELWYFEDFKREFISLFLDQGSIYIIDDLMNSWHSTTFTSARKSIDEYNMIMKYLREINLVFGGETNLKALSNSYHKFFIRTLDQPLHDQIIMHMEINDLGVSRIRNFRNVRTIHELEYRELSEIMLMVESKKEISKSLFPSKGNSKRANGFVKSVEQVITPCLNFIKGTCTYGERCFKSHDQEKINEYKKTDEYKKLLEEYKKKQQA